MTDQPDHVHDGRDYASDHYVTLKRIEILRGKLVAALRGLAHRPLSLRYWNDDGDDYATGYREVEGELPARSLLLCVAQYWNDNADDEVHLWLIASAAPTPKWPHVCGHTLVPPLEACAACLRTDDPTDLRGDFGYTDLIPAFEPFAIEGASQYMDANDQFRPLAIARIGDDGAITVEVVHPLVRPWLDVQHERAEPRPISERVAALFAEPGGIAVAADELQREGDPRGVMLAHAALGLDHAEELAQYGRSWLGSLEPAVPRSAVRYEHGVPTEIGLYIPDDRFTVPHEPMPWCFAPHIRFLPTSMRVILPGMARARSLGPLGAAELAKLTFPMQLHALEIEMATGNELEALAEVLPNLPRLRELVLVGAHATAALIPAVRGLPALERLEVAAPLELEAHVAELVAWRASGIPVTVSMFDEETQRASGWSVTFGAGGARVTHTGFHRRADDARRIAMQAACGAWVESASPTWSG